MAKRSLLAVIADEDSVPGLLLAEVRQVSDEPGKETYLLTVIPRKTKEEEVEEAFERFTSGRDDIAILLINQHIASRTIIKLFLPLHKMQYAAFSILWPFTVSAYSRYTLAHYLI
ncbi:hypothetical protein OY671_006360 [Metschnikowia pulcherrima]|nr:hypothetical protein OY671_006360 [Metschnikowia pulcherrima]